MQAATTTSAKIGLTGNKSGANWTNPSPSGTSSKSSSLFDRLFKSVTGSSNKAFVKKSATTNNLVSATGFVTKPSDFSTQHSIDENWILINNSLSPITNRVIFYSYFKSSLFIYKSRLICIQSYFDI